MEIFSKYPVNITDSNPSTNPTKIGTPPILTSDCVCNLRKFGISFSWYLSPINSATGTKVYVPKKLITGISKNKYLGSMLSDASKRVNLS